MKTAIFLLSALWLCSCTSEEPKTYYTSVMIDVTEEDGYHPTIKEIRPYGILEDEIAGKYFSITPINDNAHNVHHGAFISKAETGLFYDEMTRESVLDEYHVNVDSLLKMIDSLHYGTEQSQIFRAIITEARFLMKQECDVRRIICFSDLDENSNFFSLKNSSQRRVLIDPPAFRRLFEEKYEVKQNESFKGLIIEIHHIPTKDKEQYFDAFLGLYKGVFESRGATVIHQVSVISSVTP